MTMSTLNGKRAQHPFTALLWRHWCRSGKSNAAFARDSALSESYAHRLLSGERTKPSRDAVICVGVALGLTVPDLDELLYTVDYKPITLPQSER